jgi:2,5-diketo-D-gluconate reductase B
LFGKEGVVPVPRSSSTEHVRANLAARNLTLDDGDIERIESIEREERLENPEWMEW